MVSPCFAVNKEGFLWESWAEVISCGSIVLECDEINSSGRQGKGSGNVVLPSSGGLRGFVSSARRMLAGRQTGTCKYFPRDWVVTAPVSGQQWRRGDRRQPNLPSLELLNWWLCPRASSARGKNSSLHATLILFKFANSSALVHEERSDRG